MSSHRARSFTRAVQLHNAADEDKMTSADTNRVLTITLMKSETTKAREIAAKVARTNKHS